MEFDFAGYTFEETPVIYFKGWFISSQGTVNYQYRYIVEGEEPVFGATFTGTSDTSGVGESGANTYGFDTSCGNGAKFTINALPLEGYEGKTVTLEIIANCVDGGEIVAVRFKNITIPAASVNE